MMRWAIFVHHPDGDMGSGRIVGPFQDDAIADLKADQIRRAGDKRGEYVECIVLPVNPGKTSATTVLEELNA